MPYSYEKTVGNETILIVDDNCQTASFIELLLTQAGFSCLTADTGGGAVDIVQGKKIDLVLLDVVMPDVDGITTASKIKSIAVNEFLPVIMVTALSADEDKVAGLTHADDYITKPFSGDELLARMKSLLRMRRLHQELSKSKARFENLYENFPHLYISIDSKCNITDCNRFFRETFHVEKQDAVGKSVFTFLQSADSELEKFLKSLTLSVVPAVLQRVFTLTYHGFAEPVVISMKAVYMGTEGSSFSAVIAMEDITNQVHLQELQRIARNQLYRSARLASIGTLASGVAHELNNPLTAILGFSSALLDRIKKQESINKNELEQYLQIINIESLRCRDIVENLSKFSRDSETNVRSISLYDCIKDILQLVKAKAARLHITINHSIPDHIMVRADLNKLEQVFINILSNCFDFCPQNSTVEISPVFSRDSSKFYAIKVTDNGPGIKASDLPHVFDPFFTTKEVGKGTGMGLAICYKLMEECNGNIDIISENDNGTTVVLEIPLSVEGNGD
ncbi:MAG TPA: ATP-binding protein [Chitinispirillaceae bacterium]|nr:ATP-binding protein [Chitinispirillaceae bacterium]